MRNPLPITPYDPRPVVDHSPLTIGEFTVRRAPLRGTPRTVYTTMYREQAAGRQISIPTVDDCERHVRQFLARTHRSGSTAALLDLDLQARIVDSLRDREQDARDLCTSFNLTSLTLSPILSLLVSEQRITRRGTARRPIYAAA